MSLKYSMTTIARITIILATIIHTYSIIEYNINDELGTSFLKYTSMDLNDTIISSDLKFNLSLSRIIGTLLYAIDSQQDQLILSLHCDVNERLKIEFRGAEEYILLDKLCGCNRCKYQWLSLNLKIENKIRIKCNQGKFYEFPYNAEKRLSTAYPVLIQSEKIAIYFINTPSHEKGYPNNEQLQGCIKDVLLNGKSIDLNRFPERIPKCESSCTNKVCNTGKCYETFSKLVICDCSDSLLNGEYCNSSMLIGSKEPLQNLKSQKMKFIKLTWKSNPSKILNITYRNFKFSIKYENESLVAVYEEGNEVIKGIFPKINSSNDSTLFISFYDELVNCKFLKSNRSMSGELAVPRNISKENITSLKLLDEYGEIDIVYKNDPLEFTWNTVGHDNYAVNPDELKFKISENSDTSKKPNEVTSDWKYILLIIEVLFIIFSIIMWPYLFKKKRNNGTTRPKSAEQTLLEPLENREKRV